MNLTFSNHLSITEGSSLNSSVSVEKINLDKMKQSPELKEKQIGNYILIKEIGSGGFAKVYKSKHIPTNNIVAIKILNKALFANDPINSKRIKREVQILKIAKHFNICQLYEIMESPSKIYLVMEYCEKGELFDYIISHKYLDEITALKFFQQYINALNYLHSICVIHRDIKPENLLLDYKKRLKLIDFGISVRHSYENKYLDSPCGTIIYAPPEMHLNQKYLGELSDVWNSGIVLYAMVCGYLPFCEDNEDLNIKNIVTGNFEIPKRLSPSLIDLIKKCLEIDPHKRITIEGITKHKWFQLNKFNLTKGINLDINLIPIDEEILKECENIFPEKYSKIKTSVLSNKFNEYSSTYYIILNKKIKEGYESVSDLFSKKFFNYINDKNNLICFNKNILTLNNDSNNNKKNFSNSSTEKISKNNSITITETNQSLGSQRNFFNKNNLKLKNSFNNFDKNNNNNNNNKNKSNFNDNKIKNNNKEEKNKKNDVSPDLNKNNQKIKENPNQNSKNIKKVNNKNNNNKNEIETKKIKNSNNLNNTNNKEDKKNKIKIVNNNFVGKNDHTLIHNRNSSMIYNNLSTRNKLSNNFDLKLYLKKLSFKKINNNHSQRINLFSSYNLSPRKNKLKMEKENKYKNFDNLNKSKQIKLNISNNNSITNSIRKNNSIIKTENNNRNNSTRNDYFLSKNETFKKIKLNNKHKKKRSVINLYRIDYLNLNTNILLTNKQETTSKSKKKYRKKSMEEQLPEIYNGIIDINFICTKSLNHIINNIIKNLNFYKIFYCKITPFKFHCSKNGNVFVIKIYQMNQFPFYYLCFKIKQGEVKLNLSNLIKNITK